jgi:hypothetical protein
MAMPAAIEECHSTDRPIALDDIVGRDRPLVMRGLVSDWPMVALARQSDTAFAMRLAEFDNGTPVDALLLPPGEEGAIGYNANFDGFNYEHHRVSVTQGLQRLAQYSRRQGVTPGLAMQSALISACLPGLLETHALPLLDAAIQPRIWIGNKVTTPAHFDEFHNLACVVCGSRRFTLLPPDQARNLYIGPLDFAPTGAAISLARLDRPDDPRFPRLKLAMEHAQVAELQPGDAIYIPPMWWHHVASLERLNALVNYWWKPAALDGRAPDTALGCLLHCILSFKSLTPAERAAWKDLLDYYVFDDEDPAAHIPVERRGILGELTPELVEQLRATIRRYL